MEATQVIGMSEAKANFSRITAYANRTGNPITVFKNNKPWVEICPLSKSENGTLPKETLDAIAEAEEISARMAKGQYRFETFEDMMSALKEECGDV